MKDFFFLSLASIVELVPGDLHRSVTGTCLLKIEADSNFTKPGRNCTCKDLSCEGTSGSILTLRRRDCFVVPYNLTLSIVRFSH